MLTAVFPTKKGKIQTAALQVDRWVIHTRCGFTLSLVVVVRASGVGTRKVLFVGTRVLLCGNQSVWW